MRPLFAVSALALTLSLGRSALAEDPPKDAPKDHEGRGEGRGRHRNMPPELRDALRSGDAGATKEAREEMRKKRREHRLRELQKRLGDSVGNPAVKAEIAVHARRMARLRRIEMLARTEKKDAVLKRVEEAVQKEKARHEKRMDALKGGGDGGAPKAAPTATGGAK